MAQQSRQQRASHSASVSEEEGYASEPKADKKIMTSGAARARVVDDEDDDDIASSVKLMKSLPVYRARVGAPTFVIRRDGGQKDIEFTPKQLLVPRKSGKGKDASSTHAAVCVCKTLVVAVGPQNPEVNFCRCYYYYYATTLLLYCCC